MTRRSYDRLLAALAGAGLLIAGYLTLLHYDTAVPLVCAGGSVINCEQVLTSPSAMVLGIPVAAYGVAYFAVALAMAAFALRPGGAALALLPRAALAWTLVGTASVVWLVYQEVGVIGKLCAWCTAVHVIVLAMLVVQVRSDARRAAESGAGSAEAEPT